MDEIITENGRAAGVRLVSGEVRELTDKSYILSAEELRDGYILACQSQPRSPVCVELTPTPLPQTIATVSAMSEVVNVPATSGMMPKWASSNNGVH